MDTSLQPELKGEALQKEVVSALGKLWRAHEQFSEARDTRKSDLDLEKPKADVVVAQERFDRLTASEEGAGVWLKYAEENYRDAAYQEYYGVDPTARSWGKIYMGIWGGEMSKANVRLQQIKAKAVKK